MVTIDLTDHRGEGIARREALQDARHQLLTLATAIDPLTTDGNALSALAADLETVVHRIRWVSHMAGAGR